MLSCQYEDKLLQVCQRALACHLDRGPNIGFWVPAQIKHFLLTGCLVGQNVRTEYNSLPAYWETWFIVINTYEITHMFLICLSQSGFAFEQSKVLRAQGRGNSVHNTGPDHRHANTESLMSVLFSDGCVDAERCRTFKGKLKSLILVEQNSLKWVCRSESAHLLDKRTLWGIIVTSSAFPAILLSMFLFLITSGNIRLTKFPSWLRVFV